MGMMIKLMDKLALPIGIVLLISLFVGAYLLQRRPTPQTENIEQIVVDVEGAVRGPGVYKFNKGAIVEDAITAAGGLTENVDSELMALTVNRAAVLQSNGKVYLPIKGGPGSSITSSLTTSNGTTATGLVNINSASATQLDTLPGIGPVYAQRIIDYRTKHGGFKRKEDLMKIEGISQTKFNKLKDKITI